MQEKTILTLGIDIGTTTISAAVLDTKTQKTLAAETRLHNAAISAEHPWDKRQNTAKLFETADQLLNGILETYPEICSIGITGQMHGIVYLDAHIKPVSDLYTWQDARAGQSFDGHPSAVQTIRELTGYQTAPGYGLATHTALLRCREVPEQAARLCTVMDTYASHLTGNAPVLQPTNAASLCLYHMEAVSFDRKAFASLGCDPALLPDVSDGYVLCGNYHGIPVSAAIGDNQAGVLGSLDETDSGILANFGTGSQISMICGREQAAVIPADGRIEIRPYFDGKVLAGGSALCGGRAYAILERFFRSYSASCGMGNEPRYDVLNRLAEEGYAKIIACPPLLPKVRTTFCGTRSDTALRGCIENLGEDNFTPDLLTVGVLFGMAEELYEMGNIIGIPDSSTVLTASGNAVRRNPTLCRVLKTVFGMPVRVPDEKEEAARGAAIYAARAIGAEREKLNQ
ncbi:MAG: hypothetical protein MJ175_08115 [Clostridia bacterium]|nr:hypothetical protein [Clostridia bacterium]